MLKSFVRFSKTYKNCVKKHTGVHAITCRFCYGAGYHVPASKFHPFIHEGNISEISKKMEECIKNIERNANAKIMFYELSLQLITLLKVNRKFVELN